MIELIIDLGMQYPKETSKQKRRYSLYKCFCGNEFKAQNADVKVGHTSSCGCLQILKTKESKVVHGLTNHRLYSTWHNMIARCYNKIHKKYKYYGQRGIVVCERWHDVKNFIEDMYPTYQEGLTIDRKENDGNYEPDNCRWVSKSIQSSNTRKIRATNTTGFRGIVKSLNKYFSKIRINNKDIYLGTFNTDIEAAKAYDSYIVEHKLHHTKNFI